MYQVGTVAVGDLERAVMHRFRVPYLATRDPGFGLRDNNSKGR